MMLTVSARLLPFLLMAFLLPTFAVAQGARAELGVGIVMPHLVAGEVLRFYGVPGVEQMPDASTPFDSLVFVQGKYNLEIAYAPPWFVPELTKLDYDMLYLRARTLMRNWIEVVVNQQTGETRWIDRDAVRFTSWQMFLLDVVAVEAIDAKANPVRSGPDAATPILSTRPASLQPLAVRGDWLQVSTSGLADHIVPTGWIRWRDGRRLLITYSPLS